MKLITTAIGICCTIVLFISCSKQGDDTGSAGFTPDCSGPAKTFSGDVNPIIQSICNQAGCHASGSTNGPGPLTNHAQVSAAKDLIKPAIASGRMPQNTTLSAAQKSAIICWIDNGAVNN